MPKVRRLAIAAANCSVVMVVSLIIYPQKNGHTAVTVANYRSIRP
jgi:hypothetical protein